MMMTDKCGSRGQKKKQLNAEGATGSTSSIDSTHKDHSALTEDLLIQRNMF